MVLGTATCPNRAMLPPCSGPRQADKFWSSTPKTSRIRRCRAFPIRCRNPASPCGQVPRRKPLPLPGQAATAVRGASAFCARSNRSKLVTRSLSDSRFGQAIVHRRARSRIRSDSPASPKPGLERTWPRARNRQRGDTVFTPSRAMVKNQGVIHVNEIVYLIIPFMALGCSRCAQARPGRFALGCASTLAIPSE